MAAALGTIILGSVLGCACCLFGVKQYINSMDNPTWMDVQYWRNRQARQNGEMDNIHWLQPSVPQTPAPTVQALSTRSPLRSRDIDFHYQGSFMTPPLAHSSRHGSDSGWISVSV